MTPLSVPALISFIALTAALVLLWTRPRYWIAACLAACAAAFASGIGDWRGLLALAAFAALCVWAHRETRTPWSVAAHALMLTVGAALFLHAVPGFDNPRVVDAVVLGPASIPYTKYLNFDKGAAGLFLLGLYGALRSRTPGTGTSDARDSATTALWQFAVLVAVVMVLSMTFGYVRWDPKLPSWTTAWTWSMVFLTALPEEALFRGVVQSAFERWMNGHRYATPVAVVGAGVLFGVAHVAGGPLYIVLASVAGIGYGWIYASTRSIAWAIAAHAGLNTIHFLLFSYPALAGTF